MLSYLGGMSIEQPEHSYYSEVAAKRFFDREREIRLRALGRVPFAAFGNFSHQLIGSQAFDQMVMSPMFGAWLDGISAAVHSIPDQAEMEQTVMRRIDYIGNYAVAAALTSGEDVHNVGVRIGEGGIMIPEFGCAAIDGSVGVWASADVADGELIITSPDRQEMHVPSAGLTEQTAQWQPLRIMDAGDFTVALNDIDPNRHIYRYPVAARLSAEAYAQWCTTFRDAWDFLQNYDPHLADIVRSSLTTIVPAPAEPLTHGKSMVSGAAFGVIGINENRDPIRLASHLVYGARKYMCIALRDAEQDFHAPEADPAWRTPVYLPSREGRGEVPHLQDDSLLNIGLARFFKGLTHDTDPTLRAYGQLSFTRWYTEALQNLTALKQSGYVQVCNRELFALMQKELQALEPTFAGMPEQARQAIALNVHDRYISWRLHTVAVDLLAVTYLRNYWRNGCACPAAMVNCSLLDTIQAYVHIGQRTRYVLKEVQTKEPALFAAVARGSCDPSLFGTPTPGDIAFAQGNVRQARAYFDAAIRQQPANPEAWAGYALTYLCEQSTAAHVLQTNPELVAAVYAAIADPNVDPAALAAWLLPVHMTEDFLH